MIKKLNIQNFQSHEMTTLDFDPGVNVIVGASDSGKSAIIRALRWLIWNKPSGDAFRSNWGGLTSVEIVIPERYSIEHGKHKDQTTIMRSKSDAHNQYFWNGTDNVFKAFGNDVPEPIQEVLNMDETNLQQQGDSPFLISNTPGEAAAYFNKVAHLSKIDTTLKAIQSKHRTLSGQVTADESSLQDFRNELGEYGYIDKFEIELEQLEEDEKTLQQMYSGHSGVGSIVAEVHSTTAEIIRGEELTDLESDVDSLLVMYEDLRGAKEEVYDLNDTIQELADVENAILDVGQELRDHEERFQQLMPDVCPLCGK